MHKLLNTNVINLECNKKFGLHKMYSDTGVNYEYICKQVIEFYENRCNYSISNLMKNYEDSVITYLLSGTFRPFSVKLS